MLFRMKNRSRFISLLVIMAVFMILQAAATGQSGSHEGPAGGGMPIGHAVILGVVEGVTEYLPVSSTGHLLLAARMLGMDKSKDASLEAETAKNAADAYTICIQIGAILAVIGLYWKHVAQMVLGMMGKDRAGLRLLVNVSLGFLPAAVIGLLFNRAIKDHLFGLWPVIAAWFVGIRVGWGTAFPWMRYPGKARS